MLLPKMAARGKSFVLFIGIPAGFTNPDSFVKGIPLLERLRFGEFRSLCKVGSLLCSVVPLLAAHLIFTSKLKL